MMEIRYGFLQTLGDVIQSLFIGRKSSISTFNDFFSTQLISAILLRVFSQASKDSKLDSFQTLQPGIVTVVDDSLKPLNEHVMLLKKTRRFRLDRLFMIAEQFDFAVVDNTFSKDFSKSYRELYFTKNNDIV